jgi:hypothetical protein
VFRRKTEGLIFGKGVVDMLVTRLNNRMEFVVALFALLVVLFVVFNIRDWILPDEITPDSIPGDQGIKRVVTIYNRDRYEGLTVKENMERISNSGKHPNMQFIFVDAVEDQTAHGRLPFSWDVDYTVYFLDESGDVVWYINNGFTNTVIIYALDNYLKD